MPSEDALVELVGEAAEVFDWEEFSEESEVDISESDDLPYPYADIEREEGDEVYRLFVVDRPPDMRTDLPDFFAYYLDFEAEYEDAGQAVLVWRSETEEDFWYLRRTEDGDIGLFHSDLSLEGEDDEEE